jgi:hypothetical protein
LSSYLLGPEAAVSLGERLAPASAITDLWDKVTEENAITSIGGPSGEIIGSAVTQLYKSVGSLIHGQYALGTEQAIRFLHTPSGIDQWFKVHGIMKYGMYRSKFGNAMGIDFDWRHALISGLGFTPLQITELYNRLGDRSDSLKMYRAVEREVQNNLSIALEMVETGNKADFERAMELIDDISADIEFYDLSAKQRAELRASFPKNINERLFNLMKYAYENDKEQIALAIERITGKSGDN